jgi:hypothetical protein
MSATLAIAGESDSENVVLITTDDRGGVLKIRNKADETAVEAYVDEYGNGVVGAYNRKGMGRTLEPGPQ